MSNYKSIQRGMRKRRIRGKVMGTKIRPRLSVFSSNKHIYSQIIDDEHGITLVSASDMELTEKDKVKSADRSSKLLDISKGRRSYCGQIS